MTDTVFRQRAEQLLAELDGKNMAPGWFSNRVSIIPAVDGGLLQHEIHVERGASHLLRSAFIVRGWPETPVLTAAGQVDLWPPDGICLVNWNIDRGLRTGAIECGLAVLALDVELFHSRLKSCPRHAQSRGGSAASSDLSS